MTFCKMFLLPQLVANPTFEPSPPNNTRPTRAPGLICLHGLAHGAFLMDTKALDEVISGIELMYHTHEKEWESMGGKPALQMQV
jgi:hypothetical protein